MKHLFAILLVLWVILPSFAQKKPRQKPAAVKAEAAVKKALHHGVYDFWREIPEQAVSNDGKYLAYVVSPGEGDGFLYISKSDNGATLAKIARGRNVRFTYDSGYAVFRIKPEHDKVKEARRSKKKKEELPKDSLGILSLTTGELKKWPSLVSFQVPEKGGGWLAYQSEAGSDSTAGKTTKAKKQNDENGYTLVVRKLQGGEESSYPFVKEYVFSKDGASLAFTSTGDGSAHPAGVFVREREGNAPKSIYKGHSKHSFKKLVFDEQGRQLVFIADLDTNSKTQIRTPALFYWKKNDTEATQRADGSSHSDDRRWLVNGEYSPKFSKNGAVLFYGINPEPVVPDTTLLPEEIVNVEVWHWQDSRLQPQQKVSAETDRKRAYPAALDLAGGKSVQLAGKELEGVSLVNEGNAGFVLLSDPSGYAHEHWDWHPKSDVYLVDLQSGNKKLVRKKLEGNANASPLGKYIYWFSNPDTAWFAYSVDKGTVSRLTHNRMVRFAEEEDDHPDYPAPYGVAGWTANDEHILVYDRYDIWLIDPLAPASAVRLTTGRDKKQRYRYVKTDPEERYIDAGRSLLLRSFDEVSKQEGFYSYAHRDKSLKKLYEGDFRIGASVIKARAADRILFTKETFRDFPDWYVSDLSFRSVARLTNANPQQEEYLWGTAELVTWTAGDGTPLKGLLYKPENFDPAKKYPMMTYFYEKNSDNLHAHFAPKPIRSFINYSYFTSNGYLVFVPDIVYQVGYPGESAYNCIIPGVLSLVDKGFVDKERLGISGHSWGGYQTAYVVTRTNLFRAAEAGAPVSNMTSAYGGIRWNTGMVRQAQYERNQSRIGGTLWEKPLHFIENSPLFFADKVYTPVLMMHNDDDGAVPWYQGIEYYLALKRLGKPVWMLNYTGEKHGLTQRQNMTDFAIRLYQFFDHYLKDTPMPRWMATGLPYLEKGIRQGLEPAGN